MIDNAIFKIAGEIESEVAAGRVIGIAAVLILDDGTIRQKISYTKNVSVGLLAGTTLVQHAIVQMMESGS